MGLLHISISSMSDFMTCRRLYYWKRIKKYDRAMFSVPFLVGRIVHDGIRALISTKNVSQAVDVVEKSYVREVESIKKIHILSQEQKEDIEEQRYVTKAMVESYAARYSKLIKDAEHVQSEVEGHIQLSDSVVFVFKVDNLIMVRGKKILHELKTSKYITPDYVKHIQTDRQTASYFYAYNTVYPKSKIDEIMYDIIRKPSIRQKKNESYAAYLSRLKEWYRNPEDMSIFHIERYTKPVVDEYNTLNTIDKVSKEISKCKSIDDYYQNTEYCHSYYGNRCPYYELCHEGGESPANLKLYQERKQYTINRGV